MSLQKYIDTKDIITIRKGKVIYREDDSVVKLHDNSYTKANVINEALNHARAEESGLAIPELLEIVNYDGLWGIRTEYIEGKTLNEKMLEDPENLDEYLDRLIAIQTNVLEKDSDVLNDLHSKFRDRINKTSYSATVRYELSARLSRMTYDNKICHGDLIPSNIILHPSGVDYILDWSHATRGHAEADAATTYLHLVLRGDTELAEKYLHRYCAKTDTAIQEVQAWTSLVAAVQSLNKIPGEEAMLERWVSVVEYE